jgi:protein gp138
MADLSDLMKAVEHKIVYELHTSMLAKIVTYYPSSQTADVQPMTMGVYWANTVVDDVPVGQKVYYRYAPLSKVPVCFPGGSSFTCTWPLAAGDVVMLVFNEDSIADCMVSGDESQQTDVSRHELGHATAHPIKLPCDKTPSTDPTTTGNTKMMVGKAGGTQVVIDDAGGIVTVTAANGVVLGSGASEYVALSNLVDQNFSTLKTYLSACFAGIVAPSGGGPCTVAPATPAPTLGATGASITKAK